MAMVILESPDLPIKISKLYKVRRLSILTPFTDLHQAARSLSNLYLFVNSHHPYPPGFFKSVYYEPEISQRREHTGWRNNSSR